MNRNWAWFMLNFVFGIQLALLVQEIIQEGFSWIYFAIALTLVLMLNYHIYSNKHDTVHAVRETGVKNNG